MKETLPERMRHAAAHVELYDQEWEAQQLRDGAAEIERLEADRAARWDDGEPANLAAVAADAQKWLEAFRKVCAMRSVPYLEADAAQRFDRCIAALQKFLAESLPETAP